MSNDTIPAGVLRVELTRDHDKDRKALRSWHSAVEVVRGVLATTTMKGLFHLRPIRKHGTSDLRGRRVIVRSREDHSVTLIVKAGTTDDCWLYALLPPHGLKAADVFGRLQEVTTPAARDVKLNAEEKGRMVELMRPWGHAPIIKDALNGVRTIGAEGAPKVTIVPNHLPTPEEQPNPTAVIDAVIKRLAEVRNKNEEIGKRTLRMSQLNADMLKLASENEALEAKIANNRETISLWETEILRLMEENEKDEKEQAQFAALFGKLST